MKTAFIFPGQGSQFAGMGKTLASEWPEARCVFEQADDILKFPLTRLCFEGPEEELKLTENTQPALLTVSTAAYTILENEGFEADYVAGHSLGEYSALVAARAFSFEDAVRLVRQRGRFMQEAVPPGVGAMAALLKLPAEKLAEVLDQASQGEVVSAANLNSPEQVVIAGHAGAVNRAVELAKAAGARRAVILPVSAPFHCELMRPVQERMRTELGAVTFHDPRCPLINNWQAREVRSAADARQGLIEQIPNAVRWTESMQSLEALGVERYIEVGPGAVLAGLLKSILPGRRALRFGEARDLDEVKAA
jgi:[acyl-carrier-protein] S-malonyltransferase